MATFSKCLQIINRMSQSDQDALLARLDELQAKGLSPKEAQLQAAIDVLAQIQQEGQILKSPPRLYEDIPNDNWLQGKIDYAMQKGRNQFGVPHMSTVTGYFDKPVDVSLRVLSKLKGERGEQGAVREESLDYIRKHWDGVSKEPPYIEVAHNGEAWVSEGNHRIMVAAEKGLESLPVEIRYFDGGQLRNGPLAPSRIPSLEDTGILKSPSRQDLSAAADAIAAMDPETRDNTQIGDFPGAASGYNLYEARQLAKKPSDKLKRVTDSNSFSLWQNYDYVANVDGEHFGVTKQEDPDEVDDESKFVYAYENLKAPFDSGETTTTDQTDELFKAMRESIRKSPERVTDTPEFKRWFGDSKVVDENGKPLVVYHGTGSDITEFRVPRRRNQRNFGAAQAALGFFFTDNAGYASDYSEQRIYDGRIWNGNVMPVYLSIQNPKIEPISMIDDIESSWKKADAESYVAKLKEQGRDGIIFKGETRRGAIQELVAFEPAQIKSAIGNNGQFNPNEPSILKSIERPEFYSQLQRAIDGVPARLDNMSAVAWKQWLTANAPKLGVKAEEVEWSGIKDYLDMQGKAKLSKADLSAYLDDSGIKVTETTLYGDKHSSVQDARDDAAAAFYARGYELEFDEEGTPRFKDEAGEDIDYDYLPSKLQDAVDALKRKNVSTDQLAKYEQYTLPGGKNYREVLITLPSNVDAAKAKHRAFLQSMKDKYGDDGTLSYAKKMTPEERAEARRLSAYNEHADYRSSHWDQSNVLAHIRVNDRADSEGKRVLFVEEIQSDWAQSGTKARRKEIKRLVAGGMSKADAQKSVPMDFGFDGYIPKAPFVVGTEGWLNLALKRISMLAVEGGYDKVAFVNGKQSADRYDLSKHVGYIGWAPRDGGGRFVSLLLNDVVPVQLFVDGSGKITEARLGLSDSVGEDLEEVLGKEIAEKIMSEEKGELDRDGLKIGGKGMIKFYDQIVPQAVSKLLPKLGGEKIVETNFESSVKWSIVNDRTGELAYFYDDAGAEQLAKSGAERLNRDAKIIGGDTFTAKAVDLNGKILGKQPGFDITDKMRKTVGEGVALFSRVRQDVEEGFDEMLKSTDRTDTPEFKAWSMGMSVFDSLQDAPSYRGVFKLYHATRKDFSEFKPGGENPTDSGPAIWLSSSPASTAASWRVGNEASGFREGASVMPVYARLWSPLLIDDKETMKWARDVYGTSEFPQLITQKTIDLLKEDGYDSIIALGEPQGWGKDNDEVIVFDPTQIKSAIGNNGQYSSANADITKSPDRPWFDDLSELKITKSYQLGDLLKTSKKLSWWNRTIGTQYDLAQKHAGFKRVFDAVQRFIGDVSYYATRAADLAPTILPKLDAFKDIFKSPLSAADVKALRDPIFGGTLKYTRDEDGNIVETDDVSTAGVVFKDEELRSMFGLTDKQIGLYREFRRATNKSLSDLAISDMLRYLGKDGEGVRQRALKADSLTEATNAMVAHLDMLAEENPDRAEVLQDSKRAIKEKAGQAIGLMARGYAPLSRFGQYTVYAVGQDGEQLYFSMFENERDAQAMAREMQEQYPEATVTTGTMSQESYKLFSGVTPETLALFGESLGLEESGVDAKSEVFQAYLKMAKTNRSAMKRLIERKGIQGFSEDAGRVLAGFVYSNARQISTNLHAGEIGKSAAAITDGDVKDHAIRLIEYVQNPSEEAQPLKALLFTSFLGGNISSALVNLTQSATTTFPYLSQFDGTASVGKRMVDAVRLATRGIRNDDELKAALKKAEDEGVVSPQEVFHLMAQAQGKAQLKSGDGTKLGDAMAKANNLLTKTNLAWGRLFSVAEQANRRIAFIAAYKLARDKGMADPFAFAEKAVVETQFSTNKGIRPAWARGAVGGVLFTFKGFTIGYLEFLARMLGNGPEGRKSFALALGVLFAFAGLGGMPGADDLDDVIDGFMQRVLGKSFDSKQAKKEFFASVFGQSGAELVMSGLTGAPGAPFDLSGRLGLGNLVPGTGFATKKKDYQRDVTEIFGPAWTLLSNYGAAVGKVIEGDPVGALVKASPVAIQNLRKGMDMAQLGMYRDDRGRKVIDTTGGEAVLKMFGFQPSSVKQVQEATSEQQGLIAQNRLAWQEIRDLAVAGRVERDQEKIDEARKRFNDWNRRNPESPIQWNSDSINKGVQEANKDKAKRIADAAPKQIKAAVKRELQNVD